MQQHHQHRYQQQSQKHLEHNHQNAATIHPRRAHENLPTSQSLTSALFPSNESDNSLGTPPTAHAAADSVLPQSSNAEAEAAAAAIAAQGLAAAQMAAAQLALVSGGNLQGDEAAAAKDASATAATTTPEILQQLYARQYLIAALASQQQQLQQQAKLQQQHKDDSPPASPDVRDVAEYPEGNLNMAADVANAGYLIGNRAVMSVLEPGEIPGVPRVFAGTSPACESPSPTSTSLKKILSPQQHLSLEQQQQHQQLWAQQLAASGLIPIVSTNIAAIQLQQQQLLKFPPQHQEYLLQNIFKNSAITGKVDH